ncbi:MAG: ribosome small subunit-dependent GTPase A [Clostridia bacterium]
MTGTIIKGIGSFYTVMTEHGDFLTLKAPKKLRSMKLTPTVGDKVECGLSHDGDFIEGILERKNILLRPPVSNIDRLCIVISVGKPKPDLLMLDKMLIFALSQDISPAIIANKADEGEFGERKDYEREGFLVLSTSAVTGEGREALSALISRGTTCFAGQSAVGKSSLINLLYPDFELKTGTLSERTERGKHTTRRVELFPTGSGAILDTPGFSLLDSFAMEPSELSSYYPLIKAAGERCRFSACSHISEPDCAVKELLESGEISRGRYERYLKIYFELSERFKHRFD